MTDAQFYEFQKDLNSNDQIENLNHRRIYRKLERRIRNQIHPTTPRSTQQSTPERWTHGSRLEIVQSSKSVRLPVSCSVVECRGKHFTHVRY